MYILVNIISSALDLLINKRLVQMQNKNQIRNRNHQSVKVRRREHEEKGSQGAQALHGQLQKERDFIWDSGHSIDR